MDSVQIFLVMCGILANVSIVNPYLLLVMIAVGWFYNKVRIIYMSTAQDVKRLETVGKSKQTIKKSRIVRFWHTLLKKSALGGANVFTTLPPSN